MTEAIVAARAVIDSGETGGADVVNRGLFLQDRYSELLVALDDQANRGYAKWRRFSMGRRDALLTLVALRSAYGRDGLELERARVQEEHRRLYNAVRAAFSNWASALAHLDAKGTTAGLAVIKKRLARRPGKRRELDLTVDEEVVAETLLAARRTTESWDALRQGSELAAQQRYAEALDQIRTVVEADPCLGRLYGDGFYRETLILADRLDEAVCWEPERIFSQGYAGWELFLNLMHYTGRKLGGAVVASRFRSSVAHSTSFLGDHLNKFVEYCDSKLREFEVARGVDPLAWAAAAAPHGTSDSWRFFTGTSVGSAALVGSPFEARARPFLRFEYEGPLFSTLADMVADAENEIRLSMGLPRIGEGWVSEALMVQTLRSEVAPTEVFQQGSPSWLGRQRFDAWVPDLKLAVEYQGRQHYEAVEFFGGEEGLRQTQRRDSLKAKLSRINGVRLEYVRFDEEIVSRVRAIVAGR